MAEKPRYGSTPEKSEMNQDEINQAEWETPGNWRGPDWMAVYSSKADTRTWVPKKIPWMGWTLNLGRPSGLCWLAGFIIAMAILLVGIGAVFFSFLCQ